MSDFESQDKDAPYTRDEVRRLGHLPPTRGVYCPRCDGFIPSFVDLPEAESKKLAQKSGGEILRTLKNEIGCSPEWAKMWLLHRYGPHALDPTVACQFCGAGIPPQAKQCLLCKMNWHDAARPFRMGESVAKVILDAPANTVVRVRGNGCYRIAKVYAQTHRAADNITIEYEPA